ncbi:hypothetical protein GPB2148_2373 [marine gamma proteobacterium HTCC2148]|uniref:Uncharacterized protein n=1 Tax=uncultured marine bacterium 463 TaxID=257394 RepID=Q6SGL9_9BACT|nr:hypothetical protein MBMO_EBAC080-L32B05.91 [uncultured marine bacterium 463]EEB79443.1 hypothetical protein GPB2148_2373 [marine gamma proteobacterium HTCC2148]
MFYGEETSAAKWVIITGSLKEGDLIVWRFEVQAFLASSITLA